MATSPATVVGETREPKPLDLQVLEALDWFGHLEPTTWAGGVIIGKRPFTWAELADQLLDGGSAVAAGRTETILSEAAKATPSMFALMRVCMSCCEMPATGVTTARVGARSELISLVCDVCAVERLAEGGRVSPIPSAGEL